jgi:hypothetical protein
MKTTLAKLTLLAAIALFAFGTACKKDEQNGQLIVKLTDAPANYTAVNVDIRSVQIHHQDSSKGSNGWTTLGTRSGIYNLLELQNGVSVILANNYDFPVGKINQLRLILGDSNTVVIDSVHTYGLKTPSAQQSGLKIKVNAEVTSAGQTEILLDFDAEKSVHQQGKDSFMLKPVIHVAHIK